MEAAQRLEIDIEMGVNKTTSDHESPLAKWIVEIEGRRAKERELLFRTEQLRRPTTSVYKVPDFLRERNPKAFTPELVSFGPLHHGNPELKPMEVHKERALVTFIKRANQPLQNIVGEVYKIITELRNEYSFLDNRWKTDDETFLKMMIVDGCFMLQILYFFDSAEGHFVAHGFVGELYCSIAFHDGDFYEELQNNYIVQLNPNKLNYIIRDMLLIENQLPLILLAALVPFLSPQVEDINRHINSLVLNFVEADRKTAITTLQGLHVLDLVRQSLLSPDFHQPKAMKVYFKRPLLRCAVELKEAGVRFIKSKTKDLRDISFNPKSGEFHLPFLVVDHTMLNMIAFEHLHGGEDQYVTTYVCLLNEIINSANDVSLLHRKGIISNALGSDDDVAMLFNSIPKELNMDPNFRLVNMRRAVSKYCAKKSNQWKANLINTYFKSPWTAISLAGALFVIVLTFIQTVYAVRGK